MQFFDSSKTQQATEYIWFQHNKEKILAGRLLLEDAFREGDPDAGAFLAQTAQGSVWIWPYCGIILDPKTANNFLRESIARGSHYATACALLWRAWTPALQRALSLEDLKQVWLSIIQKSDAGSPLHQFVLAEAYLRSDFPPLGLPQREHPELDAIDLLEKALAGGLTLAGGRLFYIYHHTPSSEADMRRVLETCSLTDSPSWEENMAMWLFAQNCDVDGFRWACRAAEHGQISVWSVLGRAYLDGQGVSANPYQAKVCFELGAKNGNFAAQCELAWFYFVGEHTPRDEARAAYWAGRASDAPAGEREYIFPLLAHCMLHGIGIPKDERCGMRLMDQALSFNVLANATLRYDNLSCALLYFNAGQICEKGIGRKSSLLNKAAKAYEIACEFGSKDADARLDSMKKGLFGQWKIK